METGIPDTGTARVDDMRDATWKPAVAVAALSAIPGKMEGSSGLTTFFSFSSSFLGEEGADDKGRERRNNLADGADDDKIPRRAMPLDTRRPAVPSISPNDESKVQYSPLVRNETGEIVVWLYLFLEVESLY